MEAAKRELCEGKFILFVVLLFVGNVAIYFTINNIRWNSEDVKTLPNNKTDKNNAIGDSMNKILNKKKVVKRKSKGTCNKEVWKLGSNQKVISFCFANQLDQFGLPFWRGFNQTLNNISTLYPGWQVRVYSTGKDILLLQSKVTKRNFLYYCDVEHLPPPLNSLKGISVRMWRFAPMGDPQINLVLFRDIDSLIIQREKDAVSEFLSTSKTLHSMRDNPDHYFQIMGGMLGLKMKDSNRPKLRQIRTQMFRLAKGNMMKTADQQILSNILYPPYANDIVEHDSYYCTNFRNSKPFPTKRVKGNFVAQIYNKDKPINDTCPIECRPKNHLDWKFC